MTNEDYNRSSKITFIVFFAIVLILSFKIVSSFILAIIVGGLCAQVLKPLQKKLIARKVNSKLAAYLVFISFIVIVFGPIVFFIESLIEEGTRFTQYLSLSEISYSSIIDSISKLPFVNHFISDPIALENQIKTWILELGAYISTLALNLAKQIPSLLLTTIFILLSTIFFLLDTEKFTKFISNKIPLREDIKDALMDSFKKSSKSAIWSTLLAAAAQGIIIFIGFITLSIPAAFLASGAAFIFAFIPFVGAVPVWLAAAIYLFVNGSIIKMVLIIVFGICASLADNISRAWILKGTKAGGLHPLIGLIAVLGGIQVFGFFGVLVGPIIAALLLSMCEVWPRIWEK